MSINLEYLNQIEGWLDPRAMLFTNYLPFVASNIALEGINLHTIKDCIYHSNADFVDKIVNLY